MSYKRLFVFVEGPDDRRFFESVVKPMVEEEFDSVNIVEYKSYRNRKKIYVINYIKSIKSMSAEYLFVTDINNSPCISHKKNEQNSIYNNVLDEDKSVIVVQEIEGWYYAGLENDKCRELNVPIKRTTNSMKKEDFQRHIPRGYTHWTFMSEILGCYSKDCAVNKNASFNYFVNKHVYTQERNQE